MRDELGPGDPFTRELLDGQYWVHPDEIGKIAEVFGSEYAAALLASERDGEAAEERLEDAWGNALAAPDGGGAPQDVRVAAAAWLRARRESAAAARET